MVDAAGGGAWRAALLTPEGRALVERLTPYEPDRALGVLTSVRASGPWADQPDLVAAAMTQARLRTRAQRRFPGPARWWTPDGLEQATRPAVAALHAARFVEAGVRTVVDLGCGAGSDSVAMAEAGLGVTAVDLDPDALWALAATAGDRGLAVTTVLGDVTARPDPRGWAGGDASAGCFVDPARRRDGARAMAPQSWSPPWSWVCRVAARIPATGAKVAPGISHDAVPPMAQAEWISEGGDLLEAGIWWGPLRRGGAARRATVLRGGTTSSLDDGGGVPVAPLGGVGRYVLEPDPAVIRAGLVSVLAERVGGWLLDPRIAYVCTDAAVPGALHASFEVLEEAPIARKALRAWLRSRGYGNVVVKKRGIAVVPEELRAWLRLGGDGPTATLLLTRTDAGPLTLLVHPT